MDSSFDCVKVGTLREWNSMLMFMTMLAWLLEDEYIYCVCHGVNASHEVSVSSVKCIV